MTANNQKQLGKTLWAIVDQLRGAMNADDFRVSMPHIAEEGYNLNISRYISTAVPEPEIDLAATHRDLITIDQSIRSASARHNAFLEELGLPALPAD